MPQPCYFLIFQFIVYTERMKKKKQKEAESYDVETDLMPSWLVPVPSSWVWDLMFVCLMFLIPCFCRTLTQRNHSPPIYCNYCKASGGSPIHAWWLVPHPSCQYGSFIASIQDCPQSANGMGQVSSWTRGANKGIHLVDKWRCCPRVVGCVLVSSLSN